MLRLHVHYKSSDAIISTVSCTQALSCCGPCPILSHSATSLVIFMIWTHLLSKIVTVSPKSRVVTEVIHLTICVDNELKVNVKPAINVDGFNTDKTIFLPLCLRLACVFKIVVLLLIKRPSFRAENLASKRHENLCRKIQNSRFSKLLSIEKAPEAEAPGPMVREAGLEPARA